MKWLFIIIVAALIGYAMVAAKDWYDDMDDQ
jgi:hypothetical protein